MLNGEVWREFEILNDGAENEIKGYKDGLEGKT